MQPLETASAAAARDSHKFEALLADVFARFASAKPESIDEVVSWALGQVIPFLGGQRGGLFLFSEDKNHLDFHHHWKADGVKLAIDPGPAAVPVYKVDWVIEKIRRGRLCIVPDREELPEDAVVYLTLLEEMGLQAVVNVPIMVKGSLVGIFGFGSKENKPEWSDANLSRLELVGRVFCGALERKQAKEELRRTEERFRIAAHLVHDIVWEIDVVSGKSEVLGDFDAATGFSSADLPVTLDPEGAKWWLEHLHPDELEQGMADWKRCLEVGGEHAFGFRIRARDGTYRRWMERVHSVTDESGKVTRLIGAISDVTENQETEGLNRAILDSVPEEVVVLNREGVILSVNDTWERFAVDNDVGSTNAVSSGVNYLDACNAMGSDDEELARQAGEGVRAVLEGAKEEFAMEYPCHGPDKNRWFLMNVVPLRRPEGGAVVSHTDITHLKESEEKLRSANAEIQGLKDRLEQENIYLREQVDVRHDHEDIVGTSTPIRQVLQQVEQVAASDASVLIQGETGTGKELVASAIHNLSPQKQHAMVKVNCGALPATLVESELFGREKGAYTGAVTRQSGRFELADDSTIFLDEVGELPAELQAKLLRVLESGEFERLGSPKTIKVNVRVIAATNRDLASGVQEGSFREDLFYRLNVFPITVPPLRDRPEDIPQLVWEFVKEFTERSGKLIESVSKTDLGKLQNYPWPGNVRELRNVIERAVILSSGRNLRIEVPDIAAGLQATDMTLEEMERTYIIKVLESTGWRVRGKSAAAAILGLNEATLRSRMKKLGIKRPTPSP